MTALVMSRTSRLALSRALLSVHIVSGKEVLANAVGLCMRKRSAVPFDNSISKSQPACVSEKDLW